MGHAGPHADSRHARGGEPGPAYLRGAATGVCERPVRLTMAQGHPCRFRWTPLRGRDQASSPSRSCTAGLFRPSVNLPGCVGADRRRSLRCSDAPNGAPLPPCRRPRRPAWAPGRLHGDVPPRRRRRQSREAATNSGPTRHDYATQTLKKSPDLNFGSSTKPPENPPLEMLFSDGGLLPFAFPVRTAVTVLGQSLGLLPPAPRRRGRPPKRCGPVHSRPPPAPLCCPHITPGHCAAALAPGRRGCGPIRPFAPWRVGARGGARERARRVGAARARGG